MRRLFSSLSFRLALTYAGLFAGSLLLIFAGYYLITIRLPLERNETLVSSEAAELANTYIVDGERALLAALARRERVNVHQKTFHAFLGKDGQVVSRNLPSWPRATMQGFQRLEADVYVDGDELDFEALVLDRRFDDGARLIVGRDIDAISDREAALASAATAMLSVAVLLGILGGVLMSRAIGRRIEEVAATARQVMAGDLSGRVVVRGNGDDFDRLAATLNLMLGRMQEGMDAVRRVSDTVAHELRTPLLRLRADLHDLTDASEADRPALLDAVEGESRRLEAIFDAVLRIARIEAGSHQTVSRSVRFGKLLADVVEFYEPAADQKEQTITLIADANLAVQGDPQLLFQAVANLVDNAVKYAPHAGLITVLGFAERDAVVLTVFNTGAPVDDRYLPRLAERFFRAPETSEAPGAGLGLSLVEAVAKRHGSSIAFISDATGFSARWTLPQPPAF